MDDESIENNQHDDSEYDTGDAEAPFLHHHITTGLDAQSSKYKENSAERYVAVPLRGLQTAIRYTWQNILWNRSFWQFAATVSIAIATIFYVHYERKQLGTMQGQLTEMGDSGKQTDRLIFLYQQQLAELQKQTGDTHELAAQAKKQAEAALAANGLTREIFLAENRPWLTFQCVGAPDPKGRVIVLMTNIGKTPATHKTDIDARTRVINGLEKIDEFWRNWKHEQFPLRKNPTDVVSPNASVQTQSTPDGDYSPTGTHSDQKVVVYGRVDYSGADPKREHYWTEFCFVYNTKIASALPWSPCIDHNEMH